MESLTLQLLEEHLSIEGGRKVYIKAKERLNKTQYCSYEVIKIRQTFAPEEKQIFAVIYEIMEDGSMGRLYFDSNGQPSQLSRSLLAYNPLLSHLKQFESDYIL